METTKILRNLIWQEFNPHANEQKFLNLANPLNFLSIKISMHRYIHTLIQNFQESNRLSYS